MKISVYVKKQCMKYLFCVRPHHISCSMVLLCEHSPSMDCWFSLKMENQKVNHQMIAETLCKTFSWWQNNSPKVSLCFIEEHMWWYLSATEQTLKESSGSFFFILGITTLGSPSLNNVLLVCNCLACKAYWENFREISEPLWAHLEKPPTLYGIFSTYNLFADAAALTSGSWRPRLVAPL